MGDDDEGLLELVAQVEEELVQLDFVFRVEASRGFVGQDYRGAVDEGPGHGHPLLFAARELGRFVSQPVAQTQKVEYPFGLPLCLRTVAAADEGGYHHILEGRKFGQQLVKLEDKPDVTVPEAGHLAVGQVVHPFAVVAYLAAVGLVEGTDNLQQRGLAGAARPYDSDNFALLDGGVDSLQHLERAVALVYVFNLYHGSVSFRIT